MNKIALKNKIVKALEEQGFKINPHVRPARYSKTIYRRIQQKARFEQLSLHRNFLLNSIEKVKEYCRDGSDINPEKLSLELREVKSGSLEEIIFRWWNLVWWSIPYQRSYGRQMRFLLWDNTHDAPFGLICLQSPVLKMSVRDRYLGIPNTELDVWVNKSMHAQRVGALPPYNELLGGKMVALALTCNEIRDSYRRKYNNTVTILQKRVLKPELLFITTTSAFGKSSIYNRLKYNDDIVAMSLGYTQGSGTFHIPEGLYQEILEFLSQKGIDISRGYGHGPSRKLKLISLGLEHLGLSKYEYHGIKREFYLFPLVKNLQEVIHSNHKPIWLDRSFDELVEYWKYRWALPRAERMPGWENFKSKKFFKKIENMLMEM
ncbi:Druantia anti-phage system protein DruA [Rosettibacter firmus]|uniref:Druantia anti-phage system protein DruA n=1 Tax=Rosettibacter firmus TaxID=3111522 RepID=UPI00336BFB4D